MAGITFYNAYFPTIITALDTLEAILNSAQAHAKKNGIDVDTEYVPAKLYEDMLPLSFQIQVVSNTLKKAVFRLTGAGAEAWEDNETTFDQLFARIKKTKELVKSVKPEDINGKEGETTDVEIGPNILKTTHQSSITGFVLPNMFFHLQTTYAILRMKGVPLGKVVFLTPFLEPLGYKS
ncbi:hypothetical protein VP1G_07397 [Cytospora mali]|uniref:DUF1993 domain-containing protein n=1 Tax=Cytospora mali TaxID=578113 RepID=A0A194V8I9_CYTMA|nr:hypothetical protein VP1G_07397 [Valsa mali var. pyri (nom. inval.)]